MSDCIELACQVCGHVGLDDGLDGFFYCQECCSQAVGIVNTAPNDETFACRAARRRRLTTAASPRAGPVHRECVEAVGNSADGSTRLGDFGSCSMRLEYEDYYSSVRLRYVMGVQIMLQLQCKALAEDFHVSPLIVGFAESIWFRFVASTGIFADSWADDAIHQSELQTQGQAAGCERRVEDTAEPHNLLGQRAVLIWDRALKKTIPLSYSIVISFLACHLAREAVLPTDIVKLTLEGKLPYLAAFVEIEKKIGPPSNACPISTSHMFRPNQVLPVQKLESLATYVAQQVGLKLPPVNFYAIASRYLMQLSLPVSKILPHACRIYEWSMPPELWLSTNENRLPTRACVMSILIVSIRILYNINGFGKWERSWCGSVVTSSSVDRDGKAKPSFRTDTCDDYDQGLPSEDLDCTGSEQRNIPADFQHSEFDAAELLRNLELKYNELVDPYEFSKDMPTYLQYCKDVVFAGLKPSFEDLEEEKIIEELWDIYQNRKVSKRSDDNGVRSLGGDSDDHNRSRGDIISTANKKKKFKENGSTDNPLDGDAISCRDRSSQHNLTLENFSCKKPSSSSDAESQKERAIRRLRLDMEENRFYYIPPRVQVKCLEYVHYTRKRYEGALVFAVHADYYILLRSCARLVELDSRSLHSGVLSFERRLDSLEKRIRHCLHVKPPSDTIERGDHEEEQSEEEDSVDFSNLAF